MGFHDVQFPTDLAYGTRGGPGYSTTILFTDSGHENRIARWSRPRYKYDASYAVRTLAQLATLRQFYIARLGPAHSFRLKDWTDYNSTATDGGTEPETVHQLDQYCLPAQGDGSNKSFQIVKRYTSGGSTVVRPITKIVDNTLKVALGGTLQGGGYTVNLNTGVITFTVAPQDGEDVQCGFEFDVPVRFGDELDDVFSISIDDFSSGSIPSIPLVEVFDETAIQGEYLFGGAQSQSFASNIQLAYNDGRVQVLEATATGKKVLLPDHTDLPLGGPYFFIHNEGSNSFIVADSGENTVLSMAPGTATTIWLGINAISQKVWRYA